MAATERARRASGARSPLASTYSCEPHAAIVFARHPRARRYVIRVSAEGVVHVTIPRWGSKREAAAFVERERAWIEKQRRRADQERAQPKPPSISPEVERDLRRRAKLELPLRLFELAANHRLTVARVSIRNQRWRWGSCSRAGHISLNWRLMTMPDWVRDYIIVHELMHLKRMDHSPRFWALVAKAFPRYQEARRWLRQHPRGAATEHVGGAAAEHVAGAATTYYLPF
jgi:predicted metal-dependent hydrolase